MSADVAIETKREQQKESCEKKPQAAKFCIVSITIKGFFRLHLLLSKREGSSSMCHQTIYN